MLYPLKFKPIFKEKIWGGNKIKKCLNKNYKLPNCGESWEISGVEGDISVISNGFLTNNTLTEAIEIYMGDLVGEKVFERFGVEFPLLIKFIDAADNLSIQVHPDDNLAKTRHNAYGKTEMWYVIEADKESELISGFKKTICKEEYLDCLERKNIKSVLNSVKVKPGDVFFIPAGRVHAIGTGILLAEIQQTSDITYRIYDWNRVDNEGNHRELHTDLALEAIDFTKSENPKTNYKLIKNKFANVADCSYFTTNLIDADEKIVRDFSDFDSFVIYICIDGDAEVLYKDKEKIKFKKGETILVPAEIKEITIVPKQSAKLLETYIK